MLPVLRRVPVEMEFVLLTLGVGIGVGAHVYFSSPGRGEAAP
jgi:hypothetical protein